MFQKNPNIHEIMIITLDQKQITQASTIAYDFEVLFDSFKEAFKKIKTSIFKLNYLIQYASTFHHFWIILPVLNLQVHWNLMKRENIHREFKEEMMKIFTDEGDHSLFETLLKTKSIFIISLKSQNTISNEIMIITFASFTKIKKNDEIGLVIKKYFRCNDASLKEKNKRFWG